MVEQKPSKLTTRVRFPSPAPISPSAVCFFRRGLRACTAEPIDAALGLRSVAQLVEHGSPNPRAVGASPSTPARFLAAALAGAGSGATGGRADRLGPSGGRGQGRRGVGGLLGFWVGQH